MAVTDYSFRKASEKEKTLILNYLIDEFGPKSSEIFVDKCLWIKEGKIKEVFLVSTEQNKILKKLLPRNVYSAGIPIGSISENKFQLEIEGSYLLLHFTSKIIKIKTDQFLYGKPIFVENIESYNSEFNKGDHLIIIGNNSLHYGIGEAEIGSKDITNIKPNTILVRGLANKPLDRGWYLRKGN